MLLPQSCPWKDHLFSVEEEQEIVPTVKFVLFTDQSGKWRVQCVPKELFSFDNRSVHPILRPLRLTVTDRYDLLLFDSRWCRVCRHYFTDYK